VPMRHPPHRGTPRTVRWEAPPDGVGTARRRHHPTGSPIADAATPQHRNVSGAWKKRAVLYLLPLESPAQSLDGVERPVIGPAEARSRCPVVPTARSRPPPTRVRARALAPEASAAVRRHGGFRPLDHGLPSSCNHPALRSGVIMRPGSRGRCCARQPQHHGDSTLGYGTSAVPSPGGWDFRRARSRAIAGWRMPC